MKDTTEPDKSDRQPNSTSQTPQTTSTEESQKGSLRKEPLKSRMQEVSDKIDEAMKHLHQVPSPDKESPPPSRRQGMKTTLIVSPKSKALLEEIEELKKIRAALEVVYQKALKREQEEAQQAQQR